MAVLEQDMGGKVDLARQRGEVLGPEVDPPEDVAHGIAPDGLGIALTFIREQLGNAN